MRKTRKAGFLFLVVFCAGASMSAAADHPGAAFERLKSLVGTWAVEGSDSEVTYALTGRGTAVMEMFQRETGGMASVYHMDGNELRLTHYCGAGNQPRLRASSYDPNKGVLEFLDFVDITNLSEPDAYYTREITIVFKDEDHVQITFTGLDHGEEAPAVYSLIRK